LFLESVTNIWVIVRPIVGAVMIVCVAFVVICYIHKKVCDNIQHAYMLYQQTRS